MENHVHAFVETVVPASCTQQGYTLHRCDCGYEYKDHYVPMGTHSFEVVDQTEPTCLESGTKTLRCTNCGLTQTQGISPRGHAWGPWNLETVPSCLEEGKQNRICGCCGEKEEAPIPATGHKLTSPKKSDTKKDVIEYFCENCGQTVEMKAPKKSRKGLIALTAVVSVILVLTVAALIFMPQIKPAYHYYLAKLQIEMGSYENAYYNLQDCVKEKANYKDAQEILDEDFLVVVGEKINYDADGDVTSKYTEKYDEDDKHLQCFRYDSDNKKTLMYEEEYHEDGSLFMYAYYDYDGSLDFKYEYENDYDDNNRIIRKKTYYNGEYTGKTEYEYDKKGNMTHSLSYNQDGEVVQEMEATYNKKGDPITRSFYDADGELVSKYEFEYDKKGNCIYERYRNYENEKSSDETKRKFGKKGNCTQEISYDENGEKESKTEYEYDKDGNKIKTSYTNFKIESLNSETEREFDDRGNVTLEIEYDKNGDMESKTKYKDYQIVYLPA